MIKVLKAVLLVGIFSVSSVSSAEGFDDSVFSTLDYGLYWAGADNEFEKASVDTQAGSNYYDPDKPTIIYIHGWQSDSVETLYRETFYNTHNDSLILISPACGNVTVITSVLCIGISLPMSLK